MFDLIHAMQYDGFLTPQESLALRKTYESLKENQVRLLRSLQIASSEQIQEYLQKYFHIPLFRGESLLFLDTSYAQYLPQDLALYYSCFALGIEKNYLYIATEDPLDKGISEQISFFLNHRTRFVSASAEDISVALQRIYHFSPRVQKLSTYIDISRGVLPGVLHIDNLPVEKFILPSQRYEKNVDEEEFLNVESQLKDEESIDFDLLMGPIYSKSQEELFILEKELRHKLAQVTSRALVKLSMITNQQQAIDLMNELLQPLEIRLAKIENGFLLNGPDFTCSLFEDQEEKEETHPVVKNLEPIIYKIARMA